MTDSLDPFDMDFIGIGASRSGTTWIGECLNEHPEICFARGELHFFNKDEHYSKGMDLYRNYFEDCQPGQLKGEYTPYYLKTAERTAERIHRHFPDVKLLVSLRNPIERAYSDYFFAKGREKELAETFREALDGPRRGIYLEKGKYYSKLQHFLDFFSEDRILILFYDDLQDDPEMFLESIFRFLGVDHSFRPSVLEEEINASGENLVYIPGVNKFLNTLKTSENWFLSTLKSGVKTMNLHHPINYLMDVNKGITAHGKTEKPEMPEDLREDPYHYYKEEIEKIEELTGRDLHHWK